MTMPAFPAYNPNTVPTSRRHKAAADMLRKLVANLPADFSSDEQFAQLPDSVSPGTIDVEGYAPNVPGVLPAIPAAPPLAAPVAPPVATMPAVPLSHVDQFMQGRAYPTRKPLTADPSQFPFLPPAIPLDLPDAPVSDDQGDAKRAATGAGIAALAASFFGGNAGDAFTAYASGANQANNALSRAQQASYENLLRTTEYQNNQAQARVTQANSQQEKRLNDAQAADKLRETAYNNDADSYDKQLGYAERADVNDANNSARSDRLKDKQRTDFGNNLGRRVRTLAGQGQAAQAAGIRALNSEADGLGLDIPFVGIPGENGVPLLDPTAQDVLAKARADYDTQMAKQLGPKLAMQQANNKSQIDYRAGQLDLGDRRLDQSGKMIDANIAMGNRRLDQGDRRLSIEEQRVQDAKNKTVGKGATPDQIAAKKFAVDTSLNQLRQKRAQDVKTRYSRMMENRWTPEQQAAFDAQDQSYQNTIYDAQNYSDSLGRQIGQMRQSAVPTSDPNRTYFSAPVTATPNGSGFSINSLRNGTSPPAASRSAAPPVPRNAPPPTQHHSATQPRTDTGQFNGPPASASYDPKKLSTGDLVRKFAALAAKKYGNAK